MIVGKKVTNLNKIKKEKNGVKYRFNVQLPV